MNCGISLPTNYLAGTPRNDEDFLFLKHYQNPLILLENLRGAGVTSIELRAIEAKTDLKIASLAADRVLESGLDLTIHGYFPKKVNCHRFSEYMPPIASIVENLKNYKASSTMTLHTHRKRNTNLAKLIQFNVDVIRNLVKCIDDEKLPLKIALELNRNKGYTDPSVAYASLITVMQEVGNPNVGFCWDFGHSFWNTSKGYIELLPPSDFLDHVIHTHIHDLSPQGQTHWPLSQGIIPLEDFITPLKLRNYSGTYNLELRPERWNHVKDFHNGIYESISILTGMLPGFS